METVTIVKAGRLPMFGGLETYVGERRPVTPEQKAILIREGFVLADPDGEDRIVKTHFDNPFDEEE